MKVLHLITRLILGGAQENTVLTCEGLAARGHEVVLGHGPIYGPEGSLADRARGGGYRVVELGAMVRAVHPLKDAACYWQCRRLIREIRPNVVHTHSSKAGIVGRAAAWAEGVEAVVHTVHGLPFHDRQNRAVHELYVGLERWAARRCHAIVGITRAMVDAFEAKGIGRREQYGVIASGIELEAFEGLDREEARRSVRGALGIEAGAAVVGMVARLDPLKGHEDLLEAAAELRGRFAGLRVVFVGDGWHRGALERRVAELGLGEVVVFTGLVRHEEVWRYFAAMDVVALPSYQEGQGRTILEGYLCGCAAVGYDSGGIGEVCIDGRTGRLVRRGDRRELAAAIGWLLEDADRRRGLVEAGVELTRARFGAAQMSNEIERLYVGLLDVGEASRKGGVDA